MRGRPEVSASGGPKAAGQSPTDTTCKQANAAILHAGCVLLGVFALVVLVVGGDDAGAAERQVGYIAWALAVVAMTGSMLQCAVACVVLGLGKLCFSVMLGLDIDCHDWSTIILLLVVATGQRGQAELTAAEPAFVAGILLVFSRMPPDTPLGCSALADATLDRVAQQGGALVHFVAPTVACAATLLALYAPQDGVVLFHRLGRPASSRKGVLLFCAVLAALEEWPLHPLRLQDLPRAPGADQVHRGVCLVRVVLGLAWSCGLRVTTVLWLRSGLAAWHRKQRAAPLDLETCAQDVARERPSEAPVAQPALPDVSLPSPTEPAPRPPPSPAEPSARLGQTDAMYSGLPIRLIELIDEAKTSARPTKLGPWRGPTQPTGPSSYARIRKQLAEKHAAAERERSGPEGPGSPARARQHAHLKLHAPLPTILSDQELQEAQPAESEAAQSIASECKSDEFQTVSLCTESRLTTTPSEEHKGDVHAHVLAHAFGARPGPRHGTDLAQLWLLDTMSAQAVVSLVLLALTASGCSAVELLSALRSLFWLGAGLAARLAREKCDAPAAEHVYVALAAKTVLALVATCLASRPVTFFL